MEYSAMNTSFGKSLKLQREDIQIGYLANPLVPGGEMDTSNPENFNAVRIRLRQDEGSNGSIKMFFARAFGKDKADSEATATAAFINKIAGFRRPLADDGPYIPMLPFALDAETWHAAVNGEGPDEWKWDETANKFVYGSDGVREFNLYPAREGLGADRGIVNIGTAEYNPQHVARQILFGISLTDWEFHNVNLAFDENGELFLSGKRAIRPNFQYPLYSILGQGRIIPIFSNAEDVDERQGRRDDDDDDDHDQRQGGNVIYTITEWAGVRIIDVQMHGRDKRIIAQAGEVTAAGTVPDTKPGRSKSKFISSRVWLAD